jgi:hypothetical protein
LSKKPSERRSHVRFGRTIELEGAGPGQEPVVARMVSRNLSLGGLYCTSTHDFPEMTRLAVRLMLPADGGSPGAVEPADVTAVVVRRRRLEDSSSGAPRVELALLFTSMSDRTRERLARFLSKG